ncbi:protein tyrosine phosphatase domain-containing protein 1 isoform X6 [Aquila chrysaetos chrysaetos]|uniref:protein tyrosine phosphatase domain-containing protein 1 isoform X6 n=1 Tax=Aquila chrysaetos chrysaetos TaxID=223781 RepID=UPI001176CB93|nr:protein tyrosine phosphatase domain-containing protein 1 isoform X6 [Aquila chrysaetos chrysaetos]
MKGSTIARSFCRVTGTAMAAGVLLQNELPYSSLLESSLYLANMSSGSSRRPTAKYTKVGERLRHVIPGHMQCSMACGGRACKYENPARWSEQEQAIKGLYSSWITDNILAMARPSTELIEKYNIIEQFERCGIKTIINLQRPGEHASCGNPLEQESGFTYLPEAFMEAGIYFYNFGWKDYGVASLTTILDMVKVMAFALQEGRVAVHCHAGLGRTVNFSIGYESQGSKDASETIPHIVLQSELSLEARRVLAAKALADINEFLGEDEVKQKVEMWQKELNSRDGAWDKICTERDPFILCSLMWSWIEQLKEPIVSKGDIDMLAKNCTESQDALYLLRKEQCQTILCILHCVVNLQMLPADVEEALLARAIKAFTKTSFDSENGPYVYNTLKKVFKQTLEEKRKNLKEGTENPS